MLLYTRLPPLVPVAARGTLLPPVLVVAVVDPDNMGIGVTVEQMVAETMTILMTTKRNDTVTALASTRKRRRKRVRMTRRTRSIASANLARTRRTPRRKRKITKRVGKAPQATMVTRQVLARLV